MAILHSLAISLTPNASADSRNSLGERYTRLDLVNSVSEDVQWKSYRSREDIYQAPMSSTLE
jgi:hypothetical protein